MAETEAVKKAKYLVNIEGKEYPWDDNKITVVQIRELGNLPAGQPVLEVNLKTNAETTLSDDAVIKLKSDQAFSRKVEFKRG